MVEGRLALDQWESQDGAKRSKHRIMVESFTFVDSKGSGGGQSFRRRLWRRWSWSTGWWFAGPGRWQLRRL